MGLLKLWPDEEVPYRLGTTDEDLPAITPYIVEGTDNPAIVVCPGGGYGMRAPHEGEPIAKWLNSLGISAFVLRYRVAPYQYPCAWLDAQRAIRTIRANADQFGVDRSRIGILGFSAGGHLAATTGTAFDLGNAASSDPVEQESSRPDLLVLCYPVITMKDPHPHQGSRRNLLGDKPDQEMKELLSAEERVTANTPPTFLWHTSDDEAVSVVNSLRFAESLYTHGVPFDLHVYEKGRHGLGLASDSPHVQGWTEACASWLKERGF